jgi:hypothetical protein
MAAVSSSAGIAVPRSIYPAAEKSIMPGLLQLACHASYNH